MPEPIAQNLSGKDSYKIFGERVQRDTISKTEIIKILSKYKNAYLKKKNDIVRKIVRTLQTKSSGPMSGVLQEIKILSDKDILKEDLPFIRNYE